MRRSRFGAGSREPLRGDSQADASAGWNASSRSSTLGVRPTTPMAADLKVFGTPVAPVRSAVAVGSAVGNQRSGAGRSCRYGAHSAPTERARHRVFRVL
jgi:hypothetical protein